MIKAKRTDSGFYIQELVGWMESDHKFLCFEKSLGKIKKVLAFMKGICYYYSRTAKSGAELEKSSKENKKLLDNDILK